MPAPTVDVVVPTRDTREMTLRCLEALQEAAQPDIEVHRILVDNASSDGTAAAVVERLPGVLVLRNPQNLGFGATVNQGAWLTADKTFETRRAIEAGRAVVDEMTRARRRQRDKFVE